MVFCTLLSGLSNRALPVRGSALRVSRKRGASESDRETAQLTFHAGGTPRAETRRVASGPGLRISRALDIYALFPEVHEAHVGGRGVSNDARVVVPNDEPSSEQTLSDTFAGDFENHQRRLLFLRLHYFFFLPTNCSFELGGDIPVTNVRWRLQKQPRSRRRALTKKAYSGTRSPVIVRGEPFGADRRAARSGTRCSLHPRDRVAAARSDPKTRRPRRAVRVRRVDAE